MAAVHSIDRTFERKDSSGLVAWPDEMQVGQGLVSARAMLGNRHTLIEFAGLSGFVTGLGGVLFGNLPAALGGFGILAWTETDVNRDWALLTIPLGLALVVGAVYAMVVG